MLQLANKNILLGITGGIAAYKSAELVRRLKALHADVRVVMTPAACEFITPLTMQALSGNPVHLQLLDTEAEAGMGHIELARWADAILIAPASADFIARLTQGQGDDLLTTLCLACDSHIAIAPAMNQAMWRDPATQSNIEILGQRGIKIFGPGSGEQACGDTGFGRMVEPEELAAQCAGLFLSGLLDGKKIVITAGPTREAIDPVRYISNHSSGKMGYALAAAAVEAGAITTLISGPVALTCPDKVKLERVDSAEDMLSACQEACPNADIFVASAAVADYRATYVADQKIKKSSDTMTINLVRNPDVLATISAEYAQLFTVGFAAETQNVEANARKKLEKKQLDLIIANDVSAQGIGFNSDDNAVTVFSTDEAQLFEKCEKTKLARYLIEYIAAEYKNKH